MTLIYLGLVNSLRNIGRSLLAVAAMALAALMMTGSLTLGEGYTALRSAEYRAFLGGDILVYPAWAWPTERDVANLEPGSVRVAVLPYHFASPLAYFHPDYYVEGYLTTAPTAPRYSMFSDADQMAALIETASAHPEVTGVVPYTAVPVMSGSLELDAGRGSTRVPLEGYVLRACPPNLMGDAGAEIPHELRLVSAMAIPPSVTVYHAAGMTLSDVMFWEPGVSIVDGRPLAGTDGDAPVAIINRRSVIRREQLNTHAVVFSQGVQTVRLTLPSIVPGGSASGGTPYYDFGRPVTVDIEVVGSYDVASRLLSWTPMAEVSQHEQLYMEAPELLLSQAVIERILEAMGLPPGGLPPVGAVALTLTNQTKAAAVSEELRETIRDFSVVSVVQETTYANARHLPEKIYESPVEMRPTPLPLRQPAIPSDAGNIYGILLFGFAGLVAAGNSTLMVLSRRTEFAILKAIGMRGFEIAIVVMVEVATLAFIGLLIGFTTAEIGSLPVLLTNKVGLAAALKGLARDFGIVAAATLTCALVFALVPVRKTLRITVAEAMRGNE